jgi:hypothetical protein
MPDFDEIEFFNTAFNESQAFLFKGWFSGVPCQACGLPAFFSWGKRGDSFFSHDFDMRLTCTNRSCGETHAYSNTLIQDYRLPSWDLPPGN